MAPPRESSHNGIRVDLQESPPHEGPHQDRGKKAGHPPLHRFSRADRRRHLPLAPVTPDEVGRRIGDPGHSKGKGQEHGSPRRQRKPRPPHPFRQMAKEDGEGETSLPSRGAPTGVTETDKERTLISDPAASPPPDGREKEKENQEPRAQGAQAGKGPGPPCHEDHPDGPGESRSRGRRRTPRDRCEGIQLPRRHGRRRRPGRRSGATLPR